MTYNGYWDIRLHLDPITLEWHDLLVPILPNHEGMRSSSETDHGVAVSRCVACSPASKDIEGPECQDIEEEVQGDLPVVVAQRLKG